MKIETLQWLRKKFTKSDVIKSQAKLKKCIKYLNKLPEPQDEIERSYCQFLTQRYYQHCVFMSFLERIYSKLSFSKQIKRFKENTPKYVKKTDAVFFNPLGENIIPNEIKKKYGIIVYDEGKDNLLLTKNDCDFINEIYKKYHNAYFVYKLLYKIATYRNLIEKYHPQAIIATSEYSFCSSVLTKFCRNNGIEHINVMHGEKLFDLTSTFFEFDLCFVWDNHYIDLFLSQRAKEGQFIISLPNSIKFSHTVEQPSTDLKVFLSDETNKELRRLKKNLDYIISNNVLDIKSIKIRKHPLYRKRDELKVLFGIKYEIEDVKHYSIEESICDSKYVMARYSTVLFQAINNNIKIIIDDCTSQKLSKMLILLDYGVYKEKKHIFLSELLRQYE